MASLLALRRLLSSRSIQNSLHQIRPVGTASPASCLFNSTADRKFDGDDNDGHGLDAGRRSCNREDFLSDVFNPFSSRNLGQVRNAMDQFVANPFLFAFRGIGAGGRQGWDARENDDTLNLCFHMPGVGKEHTKVSVDLNTLMIKGNDAKLSGDASGRSYASGIDPESNNMKERKNGLRDESNHTKTTGLVHRITTASMIPAFMLYNNPFSMLVLNLSLFWHIYEGFKEILVDYVHQEVTRTWVLICLQLLVIIATKDFFCHLVFE